MPEREFDFCSDVPKPLNGMNGHAVSHATHYQKDRSERPKDTTLYDAENPPPSVAVARRRIEELEADIADINQQLKAGGPLRRIFATPEAREAWERGATFARDKKLEEVHFCEDSNDENGGFVFEALDLLLDIRNKVRAGKPVQLSEDDQLVIDGLAAYVEEKQL